MKRHARRWRAVIALALLSTAAAVAIAVADTIAVNDVVTGSDATKTVGQTGTVKLVLTNTNGDGGANGCNTGGGNPVTFNVSSSQPSTVSLASTSVTFPGCDEANAQTVGYTALAAGSSVISASYASGGKVGTQTASAYNTTDTMTVTVSAPPPSDTSAPAISFALNPALPDGDNGWYKSSVGVDWTVTDNESAISSSSGCDDTTVTGEGTHSLTCQATSSGGTSSETAEFKIDKTAPTINDLGATVVPPDGENGWYTSDVTNQFKAEDALSGLSTTCAAAFDQTGDIEIVTTSTEGSAVTVSSSPCSDKAGNSASSVDSDPFMIDKTAPTSSSSASNADDSNYTFGDWTNQSVTVTLTGDDKLGGSGLDDIRYTTDGSIPSASDGIVYSSPFPISTEGTTTVKFVAIDIAGNAESAVNSKTVKIDTTDPTISDLRATVVPPDGENGWYTSDVTNQFKAEDALSGLNGACSTAFNQVGDIELVTTSDEGSAVTVWSSTCSDNAGNSASGVESDPFMIDKTAPMVSVTGVADGGSYTVGSVPSAGCSTSDDNSGVQTPATLTQSGGPVGSITATCSGAKDIAGNTAAGSATYSVVYPFTGFFQPVDMNGVFNRAKAGSAIPVKFSLDGAPQPGSNTPGLAGASSAFMAGTVVSPNPVAALVACPSAAALVDVIEEVAADSVSGLKYDPTADQWIYVWKTPTALANSCRQLRVVLADGTTKTANFQFTK